jgi:hypothetical protein
VEDVAGLGDERGRNVDSQSLSPTDNHVVRRLSELSTDAPRTNPQTYPQPVYTLGYDTPELIITDSSREVTTVSVVQGKGVGDGSDRSGLIT